MKLKLTVKPNLMFARQFDSSVWDLTTSDDTKNYAETLNVVKSNDVLYRISAADYALVEQHNGEEFQCKIQNNVVIIATTTTYIPHTAI